MGFKLYYTIEIQQNMCANFILNDNSSTILYYSKGNT